MRLKSTLLIFLSTACLFWHSPLCSASDSLLERHYESDVSDSDGTFHVARSRGLKSKGGKTYEEAGYYRPSYMYHRPHVPDYGGGYDQSGVYGGYDGYGAYGGYYYGNFQSGSKKSKAYQQYPVYYHPKSQKKAKKSYNYVVVNPLPPLEGREEAQTIYEIINQIVNLSTLASLVNSPGQEKVVQTLDGEGPVTLFAPLNSAFDELFATVDPSTLTDEELSNALNYHIVAGRLRKRLLIVAQQGILFALNGETISYMANGREVTLNEDALIIKGNIRATNGIIHVIDKVLIPAASEAAPSETIAAELEAAGNFNTFLELLAATDLLDSIEDPNSGPYTIFAPTDAAFSALLAETGYTIPQLITDFDFLTSVLLYHSVDGVFTIDDLANINSLRTLEGESIAVDGTTLNSEAEIIYADQLASNGIIQVIDKVLIPPSEAGAATPPPTSANNTTPTSPPTRNNGGTPSSPPTTVAPTTSGPTVAGTASPTVSGSNETLSPTVAGSGGTPAPTVAGSGGTSSPTVAGSGGTPSPTSLNGTVAPTVAGTSTDNSTNTTTLVNGTSATARSETIPL